MGFKKYSLTETQLKKITRLCVQEQGNLNGIRAEASLMANQLETSAARQKKYGTNGTGLYNWVRNGGWFYRAAYFMDYGSANQTQIEAVRNVLVNGKRFFPQYIDEHDCISDIKSISTGSKGNREDYQKNKTIIRNVMGSTYTFYCFPAAGCDPFGYTKEAYDYVKKHGGASEPVDPVTTTKVTAKVPIIQIGDCGKAVKVWQAIVGTDVDGDFGKNTAAATKALQKQYKLTQDGIVGAETWAKGLNLL
jgi:peptidoglycan hydrolase-like protein with peptidoglycan-binding domain